MESLNNAATALSKTTEAGNFVGLPQPTMLTSQPQQMDTGMEEACIVPSAQTSLIFSCSSVTSYAFYFKYIS